MKANDWIAINLNIQGTNIQPDDLRLYNINPDNTGIREKSYYESIPQIQNTFKKSDGSFDSDAFTNFYNSAKRSYTDFATNDYVNKLIQNVPSSANDTFSLGNSNIADDTARIVRTRDPQRHAIGIGNIFETGAPSFSEREVAQSNKVLDENGIELDWSPEDKGGIFKALFRPTLALAVWDKDETVIENGIPVHHRKGEHKYDANGDPQYQILGKNEIYGRDVLHVSDTLSKEGTFWNKIDIFDNDGVKSNAAKTIARTVARIAPYLTPYGYVFGAIEASKALGQTLPVLTKMLNGMLTNDNDNFVGQKATSVENFMSRFGTSQSDEGQGSFWSVENIGQMIADSASQLYSQRLIQKIPKLLAQWQGVQPSIKAMQIGQNLSLAYMAATSAEDVYGAYKQAGVNDAMAGVGALATMGAFYAFMNNEYFKEMLFRDPAMELPELKQVLHKEGLLTGKAIADRQLANEGLKVATGEATQKAAMKWYQTAYTSTKSFLKDLLPKIKNIGSPFSTNVYLSRAFNEGLEEVMEESVTDLAKAMTLGLQSLGLNIKDKDAAEVDFGFSPEDFLSRYTSSFIGGAIGGAVFEGLTQYDNKVLHKNLRYVSDLEDTDLQLTWYIRNGYGQKLLDIIDNWEKRGKFGTKDLSWSYKIDTDTEGNKKLVYDTGTIDNNQNTGIANLLRQRIKYKAAQLESLNLMQSDNDILSKAIDNIKEEAKTAGYTDLDKFKNDKLRDERIDYIRSVGVDKIIISDVADLQSKQTRLLELIEDREVELSNVPDSERKTTLEDDATLKRYHKELDASKKQLDELLSGKRASEYLSLGIFLGDKMLKDIYVSDLNVENNTPTYFEESVKNFVRAKYGENYDEIVAREGEKTKEFFESEYAAWVDSNVDSKLRLREAFALHQRLSEQILPVIEKQIAEYSEYKHDPERSNVIIAAEGSVNWDEYEKQLVDAESQLKQAIEAKADAETITNLTTKVAQLQQILNLRNDPKRILEVLFNDSEESNSLEKLAELQDNKTILQFLKNYYTRLNNEKIVSEFSDDLLNRGLQGVSLNIADNILGRLDVEGTRKGGILNNLFLNLSAEANDLGDVFLQTLQNYLTDTSLLNVYVPIIDSEGNQIEMNVHDALNELNNLYNNGNVIITFNGKTQHILDHIQDISYDADLEQLGDDFAPFGADKTSKFNQNSLILDESNFALLKSKFKDVIDTIGNNPDSAEIAYKNLISFVAEAIRSGNLEVANVIGNAETDAKNYVDSILFSDGVNIIDEINQLKQLRANMIHTPILDWIEALSINLNGFPTHLWQMLKDEQKRLYDKQRLDDYVIKDPFVLNELQFLQSALYAAKGVLRGMLPFGANMYINKLRKDEGKNDLPFLTNFTLSDVYGADLDVISARLDYLLDLNAKNQQSTVKQKKQSMIVGAPKIIDALIHKTSTSTDEPQVFIGDKLKSLGVDVEQIWNDSGGRNLDLNAITEDNFPAFWQAMRNFMNSLFDKVQAFTPTDGKNRLDVIVDTLISGFTDLWKLKNSTISHKKESVIENLDLLYWLASTIVVDPRTTYGLIKTVQSTSQIQPFWDQLLNIQLGFARLESPELFNKIIDRISDQLKNLPDLSDDAKVYMSNKVKAYNSMFIDGAAGTGKTQVVLLYIREMRKLLHPEIGALAVSQYQNRTNALQKGLKISSEDTYTKAKLIELLLGRPLTNDDYESRDSHVRLLKKSVLEELSKRSNIWKDILKDRKGLDIYVDESGFISEAEFEFFSEVSKLGNINFIFAGDKMQNGVSVESEQTNKETGAKVKVYENSGVFDIIGINGPRLNLSMRAGNLGMINNLNRIESMIQKMLDVYADKPWLSAKDVWDSVSSQMTPFKFEYFETTDALYGIAPTSNATVALEKLQKLPKSENLGPKIVIITDHVDDYSSYRSSDIDVLDIGAVQGGEYDYYLIDIKNIANSNNFDYIRNVYTIISRARIGGYVVNDLGAMFPGSSVNNTASIIVNPKASSGEDSDSAMDDWKTFFNNLFEPETWSAEKSKPVNPVPNTPPPPAPLPGSAPSEQQSFTRRVVEGNTYDAWKGIDEWKATVKAKGKDASSLLTGYGQKTKKEDFENYKRYYQVLESHENDGTLIDIKSFIDWLFSSDSDDIVFGKRANIINELGSLTSEQRTHFKELIRNLSLDLIILDTKSRKEKYSKLVSKAKNNWLSLAPNIDKWSDSVDRLFNAVASMNDLELYAVPDGEYSYLYFTYDNMAIPVMRIKGSHQQGYVKINTSEQVPMVILSTDGNTSESIKTIVGNYVDLHNKAFIIKVNEDEIITTNEEVLRYIRQNKGKPIAYMSSTFDDDDVRQIMSVKKDNGDKIERLDFTGESNGNKRLNAISKRINLSTYVRLSNLLHKIHTQPISEDELNELRQYFPSEVMSLSANDDVEEVIRLLRKFSLLGQQSRAQLTGALMRYFWNNRESNPNAWLNFRQNILANGGWVTSDTWLSKDKTKIRQKGLSFTIYGDTGTYETYNILYNHDDQTYQVRVQAITEGAIKDVVIGTLTSEQWSDAQNINPIQMARTILNLAKEKVWDEEKAGRKPIDGEILKAAVFNVNNPLATFAENGNIDDSSIETLFANGKISIGLTTRQESIVENGNNDVNYFAPFDYDVASLLRDTNYNDTDLNNFLKEDAIFKYGFIVSVAGENYDDIYLTADVGELITDACEILPPLYNIDFRGSSKKDSSFGSLNHKIITSNPSENILTIERDASGKVEKYSLEKYFTIQRDKLLPYVKNIPDSAFITVVRATPNSVTIKDINGAETTYSTDKDPIELFEKMPKVDSNDNIVATSGDYYIVKDENDKYVISHNGNTDKLDVLTVTDNTALLVFNDDIVEFSNLNQEVISILKSEIPFKNFAYLGIISSALGNTLLFVDGQRMLKREIGNAIDDSGYVPYQMLYIDPSTLTLHISRNGINEEISITKDMYDKITSLGSVSVQPSEKTPEMVAKEQFSNISDLSFDGIEEPDVWARANAAKLGGIFMWNGKDAFVKDRSWQSQMLMTFANWKSKLSGDDVQDIIDSVDDIQIDDGENTNRTLVTFIINGLSQQLEFKRASKNSKWVITELTSQVKTQSVNDLVNDISLSQLSDDSKKNLIAYLRAIREGDSASLDITNSDEFNNWLTSITANSVESELIRLISNSEENININEICNNYGLF